MIRAKNYNCPRCGNPKIIDYGSSFDCPECDLEFEKVDFHRVVDESNILSVKEKLAFMKEIFY